METLENSTEQSKESNKNRNTQWRWTISFEAHEFSTYGLAYKDTRKADNSTNNDSNNTSSSTQTSQGTANVIPALSISPKTGDTGAADSYMMLLIMAVVILTGLTVMKKRKN